MAAKSKTAVAKPKDEKFPRKSVQVQCKANDSEADRARQYAATVTSPELAAYRVINGAEAKSGIGENIDVPSLMADLRAQGRAVNDGEMRQVEAMLINQATALQSLFARLAERGMGCDQAPAFEANMRMALRSQAQCRATLETLATIKNPPVVFAKQANIANGHQQINNGVPAREEKSIQSNELSGAGNEILTDARASQAQSRVNQEVEAVGAIHGAKD